MITHSKQQPNTAVDQTAGGTIEQHHGDLRKGAYLKRRAAYQMQADSNAPSQLGTLSTKNRNPG